MIVQALMAELHTMIFETWKDTQDLLLLTVFALLFVSMGEMAGNVGNKVCELIRSPNHS